MKNGTPRSGAVAGGVFGRRRGRGRAVASAFTLIELMVAVAILAVLGLMLITSLRTVVKIVATGTSRGDGMASAATLVSRVESDLEQMFAGRGGRLVAGRDPYGRPWVGFVRCLPEERSMAGGYYAGTDPGPQTPWRGFSSDGSFIPMGGMCEVVYLMKPTTAQQGIIDNAGQADAGVTPDNGTTTSPLRGTDDSVALYRAQLAPIGGSPWYTGIAPGNGVGLFDDLQRWSAETAGAQPESAGLTFRNNVYRFDDKYQQVAANILYFGVAFWDPLDPANPERGSWLEGGDGPSWLWDTATDADVQDSGAAATWPIIGGTKASAAAGTRGRDFPRAAMVSVTVAMDRPLDYSSRLVTSMGTTDSEVVVQDSAGWPNAGTGPKYLRVDHEWMEYQDGEGGRFLITKRGARGTQAIAHEAGAPVRTGFSLTRIVSLPAGR
jgi:prepilin-type N-terminal cleavage/methylation domain-containing protein